LHEWLRGTAVFAQGAGLRTNQDIDLSWLRANLQKAEALLHKTLDGEESSRSQADQLVVGRILRAMAKLPKVLAIAIPGVDGPDSGARVS